MDKIMASFLIGAFILTGCGINNRYVRVAEESIPKTVTIYVSVTVEQYNLVISTKGLDIERSTVTATVSGAGSFISDKSHIITCDHLFEFDHINAITVCNYNGDCTAGELLYNEESLDLALVKSNFDEPTSYLTLADPRTLKVGQEVMAIGDPLGFDFSVSHGIISALNRDNIGIYNATQSDTFINPGNSGGPLLNLKGELIGVNSRIVPPVRAGIFTGLGFSVSAGQIREFLTRYKKKFSM